MKDIIDMDEETTVFDHIEDLIILVAFIAVIFLKLLGIINISWFWVLSPLWFFGGLAILFILIMIIVGIISLIKDKIKENKNERN